MTIMNEDLDLTSMRRRLERLERRITLMVCIGAGVGTLLISILIVGWAGRVAGRADRESALHGSSEASSIGRFVSVVTQEFKLEDRNGRLRATIAVGYEDHSGRLPVQLTLYDESGDSSIELSAGSTLGPALDVMKNGMTRARLGMNGADPLVQLSDDKAKASAVLWLMNGSPHLVMTDEAGRPRAVFGYDAVWPGGADRPEDAAPSVIALYDERGRIVWSATQIRAHKR